jgi:predicted nuclease with TOPRIM domain
VYGVALIVVLAIAGGVIAYAGDRIGMKVGRKRLSVFGLRPKYTSIIITVITGVVIAGCSILLLSLASENVRKALFQIREIQETLFTTQNDLEAKRAEAEMLSKQVGEITGEYEELKARFDEANRELERVSGERTRAVGELARVQARLGESEERLRGIEARFKDAAHDLGIASAELESAQAERSKLEQEKAALQASVSSLTLTRDELTAEVASLERKVDDIRVSAAMALAEAAQSSQTSMIGRVIFRADEVVLGRVIDASQPAESIDEQVRAFLLEINDIAVRRGSGPADEYHRNDGDTSAIRFDLANASAAFAKIMESRDKVVLRAVSPVNTWYGGVLLVSLHVFPEKRIFEGGQVVASRAIDGSAGIDKIQEGLLGLMEDVNSALVAAGMPTDEEGKIGTILTVAEFASAITNVLSNKVPVTVQAVAECDIWRIGGPLSLKLVINPA